MRPGVARGGGLPCRLAPPEPRRGRGNRRGDLGGAVRGAGRSRVSCTLCSAPVVRHLSGGAAHLLARGDRGRGCRPCESVSPELAPRARELVAARLPFRDDVGDWHAARAAAGLPVGAHAGAPLVGGGRGDGERVPAARRARATTAPDAHTAGGGPRRPALRGPRHHVAGPSPLVARPCWMLEGPRWCGARSPSSSGSRSEEHTSELQSLAYLVCRLLLEKKKKQNIQHRLH